MAAPESASRAMVVRSYQRQRALTIAPPLAGQRRLGVGHRLLCGFDPARLDLPLEPGEDRRLCRIAELLQLGGIRLVELHPSCGELGHAGGRGDLLDRPAGVAGDDGVSLQQRALLGVEALVEAL